MMGLLKVSIDPGTNATGYCVWKDGRPSEIGTVRPSGKARTPLEKLLSLRERVWELFNAITTPPSPAIHTIAVEAWQKGVHRGQFSVDTMRICGQTKGMIIAVATEFSGRIVEASKGTLGKGETELRARAAGLIKPGRRKPSKDALDAYEIGICAGFDRKLQ